MFDLRPLSLVIGYMLMALGAAMTMPALFDFAAGNHDWRGFLLSSALTLFTGYALVLAGHTPKEQLTPGLNLRQAFLLTSLSWIMISAFAALPFIFIKANLTISNAVFEAVSGFTTTGSTVIVGLDATSPGTLLWRGLLQWAGGVGIVVIAITMLPLLQVGGMQLFHTESSDRSEEKILPRLTQISRAMGLIYLGLSFACALSFWASGMNAFDAVVHMMATVSTGGFSTSDKSFANWDSPVLDMAAILFMFLGALPIMLFWPAFRGKPKILFGNTQVLAYFAITAAFTATLTVFQWYGGIHEGWQALRFAAFSTVSIITSTGFMNTDYGLWGPFATNLFIVMMLIGGCSGSTAGGFKIFRLQILYLVVVTQIRRIIFPNGIFTARYNERSLHDATISSVTGFLFLYLLTFAGSGLILTVTGLDATTAFSAAAAMLGNAGPGMGPIVGPAGNFSTLSAPQIWVLTITMLLGRLELLTVYVLFLPRFWRT